MDTVQAQMGRIMGEALERGYEREVEERFNLLMLRCHLLSLQLRAFLEYGIDTWGEEPE